MHGWYLFNGFYGLPFFLHYCPVKLTRFLPSVEMTGHPWVFMEDGVGGGEAATNPILHQRKCLSSRTKQSGVRDLMLQLVRYFKFTRQKCFSYMPYITLHALYGLNPGSVGFPDYCKHIRHIRS